MSFASQILATLNKNGEAMSLIKVTPSATPYNPATGLTAASTSTLPFKGCITGYADLNANNSLVINNLFKALIPALGLGGIPEPQDKVVASGVTYDIIEVMKVRFMGVPAVYICKVKV